MATVTIWGFRYKCNSTIAWTAANAPSKVPACPGGDKCGSGERVYESTLEFVEKPKTGSDYGKGGEATST